MTSTHLPSRPVEVSRAASALLSAFRLGAGQTLAGWPVLVTRVFVDVRGNQNSEPLFTSRQWNRTTNLSTSTFRGFHDFLG